MKDIQLLIYSSCTVPSLAGVYGCRDNDGGVEVQFNLEAKHAGLPHVVKSSEDCAAFASFRVLISASTSPSLDITLPR